jgi:hypothetical protein
MIAVLAFVEKGKPIDHELFWSTIYGVVSIWVLANDGCQFYGELPPRTNTAKLSNTLILEFKDSFAFQAALNNKRVAKYLQSIKDAGGHIYPVWLTGEMVSLWQGNSRLPSYLPNPVKYKSIIEQTIF